MTQSYSQSFYDLSIQSINDKEIKMADFKDKYVLVVNVASFCGYTSQYTDLQVLSEKYAEKLVVLGVPCNQFGSQEPGSSDEIQSFCQNKYNIGFPITEKVDVKGKNQHPLYTWLTNKSDNNLEDYEVSWNFNKFLISPDGKLISYFKSSVKPLDEKITNRID